MRNITVVGCGVMGSCLVKALMTAGHQVVIVDLNKAAAEPYIEKGAQYSETLQDAPETEIVILNCPSHKVAKIVMDGVSKARMDGKYLINTTTCGPRDVEEMAEIAKALGMTYLEAKIESYPQAVATEEGYILYSGDKKSYDELESDVLKAFGNTSFLDEDPKAACVVDISFLGVHYGAVIALLEAASFCHKNGFSMQKLGDQLRFLLPDGMEENYRSLVDELSEYNGEFKDSEGTDIFIEKRGALYCKDAMNSSGVDCIFTDWLLAEFDKCIDRGEGHKNIVAMVNSMMEH